MSFSTSATRLLCWPNISGLESFTGTINDLRDSILVPSTSDPGSTFCFLARTGSRVESSAGFGRDPMACSGLSILEKLLKGVLESGRGRRGIPSCTVPQ